MYVSQLALRVLVDEPAVPPPVVQASSWSSGAGPSLAIDGSVATAWKSDPAAGPAQAFTIDFHRPREFGGLALRWLTGAHASRYDVQFSEDGVRWRTVRSVVDGRGGPDALLLPEAETRFLRLALHDGPARAYGLAELEITLEADGRLAEFVTQRYRSWDSGIGEKIEKRKVGFRELEAYMLKKGDADKNISGRQEMIENIINRYLR